MWAGKNNLRTYNHWGKRVLKWSPRLSKRRLKLYFYGQRPNGVLICARWLTAAAPYVQQWTEADDNET